MIQLLLGVTLWSFVLTSVLGSASIATRHSAAGANPAPVRFEDPPVWQRVPGGAFENCADNFECAGYTPVEANRLAHIAIFGKEPTVGGEGCDYYTVTTYYCAGTSRKYTRQSVSTICIEQLLGSCPVLTCPSGQQAFFKLTTAEGCKPASTCVWVEVSGPHTSGSAEICDNLTNCDCWPGLSCAVRECVPVAGIQQHPTGCPNCP